MATFTFGNAQIEQPQQPNTNENVVTLTVYKGIKIDLTTFVSTTIPVGATNVVIIGYSNTPI